MYLKSMHCTPRQLGHTAAGVGRLFGQGHYTEVELERIQYDCYRQRVELAGGKPLSLPEWRARRAAGNREGQNHD